MTPGMQAWLSAEPVENKYHLIAHFVQAGREERTEMVMYEAIRRQARVDALTRSVAQNIRETLWIHSEMNVVDALTRNPVGSLLDEFDDVIAFANMLDRCKECIESGRLYHLGNHLVSREHAQKLLSLHDKLAPYTKQGLVMGDQTALHAEMHKPLSDLAKGFLHHIIVP